MQHGLCKTSPDRSSTHKSLIVRQNQRKVSADTQTRHVSVVNVPIIYQQRKVINQFVTHALSWFTWLLSLCVFLALTYLFSATHSRNSGRWLRLVCAENARLRLYTKAWHVFGFLYWKMEGRDAYLSSFSTFGLGLLTNELDVTAVRSHSCLIVARWISAGELFFH